MKWRGGERKSVKMWRSLKLFFSLINVRSHVRASRIQPDRSIIYNITLCSFSLSSLCCVVVPLRYHMILIANEHFTYFIQFSAFCLFLLVFFCSFRTSPHRLLLVARERVPSRVNIISLLFVCPEPRFTTCSCCFNIILIKKSSEMMARRN